MVSGGCGVVLLVMVVVGFELDADVVEADMEEEETVSIITRRGVPSPRREADV